MDDTWSLVIVLVAIAALKVQDWHQLWVIASAPDNVPIVAMLFLVPFFTWLGVRQALANDRLVTELEGDQNSRKLIIVKLNRGDQVGPRSCTSGHISFVSSFLPP